MATSPPLIYPQPVPRKIIWQAAAPTPNKTTYVSSFQTQDQIWNQFRIINGATLQTILSAAIGAGATTAPVASANPNQYTSGFPTSGKLLIGTEKMTYTGRSGFVFSGLVRGVDGTVAAAHPKGSVVALVR
jgi:hypothetical protein